MLKLNSRGEDVRHIQILLNLIPDGIYGKLTEEAVRQFQRDNNLTPDGIVGPQTRAALIGEVPAQSKSVSDGCAVGISLKKTNRSIDKLIVHCTATPEGKDYTVDTIRSWHKAQGWSDIGYHYVIYRDGTIHEGRHVNLIGAHTTGHNSHSIGIVYVGGCSSAPGAEATPKDTRTPQQRASLTALLTALRKLYPHATIHGHRDFAAKACPSFDAKTEYAHIK